VPDITKMKKVLALRRKTSLHAGLKATVELVPQGERVQAVADLRRPWRRRSVTRLATEPAEPPEREFSLRLGGLCGHSRRGFAVNPLCLRVDVCTYRGLRDGVRASSAC
jgi:hypothetical protein